MLQRLRKAGEALAQFDERYANRAAEDMGGKYKSPIKIQLGAIPFNKMGLDKADTQAEEIAMRIALGGVMATNAGYRYGLPAAGATLAVKGASDLITEYGSEADQPEQSVLGM